MACTIATVVSREMIIRKIFRYIHFGFETKKFLCARTHKAHFLTHKYGLWNSKKSIFQQIFEKLSKIHEICLKIFWNFSKMCKNDKKMIFYNMEHIYWLWRHVYQLEERYVDEKITISKYVVKPHVLEQKKHAVLQRTFKR